MLSVAQCHMYAECRHAECRYSECHFAECRSAVSIINDKLLRTLKIQMKGSQVWDKGSY